MPLTQTSVINSAQGYGLDRGSSGSLVTYTFPSGTSTWTAPTGVTNLVSAVGKGADGTASTWTPAGYFSTSWATGYSFGSGGNTTQTWGTLYAEILSHQSTVNAGGSGTRTLAVPQYNFEIYADGSSSNLGVLYSYPTTFTIRGTGAVATIGSPPSSGTVTYAQVLNNTRGWYLSGLEYYTAGTTGANTTGFGLTFPGGVEAPASTTTFNNVVVTPGTTYTIVNNQSLVITYYT